MLGLGQPVTVAKADDAFFAAGADFIFFRTVPGDPSALLVLVLRGGVGGAKALPTLAFLSGVDGPPTAPAAAFPRDLRFGDGPSAGEARAALAPVFFRRCRRCFRLRGDSDAGE